MDKLQAERLCRVLVEKCIGIRPGEVSLIVTSPAQSAQVSKELFRSLTARGSRSMMLFVPEVLLTEDRLPSAVATSMKQAHAALIFTQRMFPISARDAALKSGTRILSVSASSEAMLMHAADVDYDRLETTVLEAVRAMLDAGEFSIQSPAGTDLTVRLDDIPPRPFTGLARHSGEFSEIPAGGVNAAVARGKASGRIVVDASISDVGVISTPVVLTVVDGEITTIEGGEEGERLRQRLGRGDENSRLVTEVGVGFNPHIALGGAIKEDQRALGVGQLGFGRNSHLGGQVHSNVHLDVCMKDCRFVASGKQLF